jgi:hypothetical protein
MIANVLEQVEALAKTISRGFRRGDLLPEHLG